jgi:hypothetical protein
MTDLLERAKWFFQTHQNRLVEKYQGQTIVIVGKVVVGVYDDEATALREAQKSHELGTFLIRRASREAVRHG